MDDEALSTDVMVTEKLAARFENTIDPQLHQYGAAGHQWLMDDMKQMVFFDGLHPGVSPDERKELKEEFALQADKRAFDVLSDRYGAFFLGNANTVEVTEQEAGQEPFDLLAEVPSPTNTQSFDFLDKSRVVNPDGLPDMQKAPDQWWN